MHLTKSCSTTNMYTFSVHQRLKSRIDRRSLNQWVYQWLTAVFESQLYPDLVLLSWIWCCTDDDDDYDAISNRMCMSKRRVVYLSDDESAVREHRIIIFHQLQFSWVCCSAVLMLLLAEWCFLIIHEISFQNGTIECIHIFFLHWSVLPPLRWWASSEADGP